MNRREGNAPTDEIALDRLVDGELSREEYAAMLRSLDQTPDGWRRCALAFLEAQAWQHDLGQARTEAAVPMVAEVAIRQAATKTKAWPLLLAVAASFVLAFGLGLAFRPGGPLGRAGQVAPPIADRGRPLAVPPEAGDLNSSSEPAIAAAAPISTGNVRFVVDHGQEAGSREVDVPVYEWAAENEPWLSRGPLAPSFEMRRAVQRGGHDVRMHRHFIPLETGDGRHVLIPVEQMEITPAGRRVFQ